MDVVTLGIASRALKKEKFDAARRRIPVLDVSVPSVLGNPPTRVSTGTSVSPSPISGATIYSAYTSGVLTDKVTFRNAGRIAQFTQNSVNYAQNYSNAASSAAAYSVETEFDGDDITFIADNNIAQTSTLWLWVDGHPATVTPELITTSGGSSGQPYHYRITFPTVAVRRLRVWFGGGAVFGGISYDPLRCYASATAPNQPRCFYYGDSWVGGALNVSYEQLHAYMIPRYLGWEAINGGQGSTGFTTAGTGAPKAAYTDSTRLAEIASANPDYIIVQGSQNDDAASAGTVGTAASTVFTTLTASCPNAKLIVLGAPVINATAPAQRVLNNAAIATAAAACGIYAGYYDPISAAELQGSGYEGHPNSNGNAGLYVGTDQAHLNTRGHQFLARRRAHVIAGLLAARS